MQQSTLSTDNHEHTNTLNEANQLNTVRAPAFRASTL
jgi:hypothetical protein